MAIVTFSGGGGIPLATQHQIGTLGARPAADASNANQFYYATDNTTLYLSDGSSWNVAAGGSGDLLSTNNLSDVANAATSFSNIKQAASDTTTGVVELATIAEVDTGTDTTRAITPAGLAGSALQTKVDGVEALADVTDAANVAAAGAPIISSGAGAPGTTPATEGDIYIDTTADRAYIATGAVSSADWDLIPITGAQIKTLYEAEADTNAYTDADASVVAATSGTNTGDEAAASTTVAGVSELATVAEIDTGTDNTRTITPLGLAGSALQTKADSVETGADVTDATNVSAAGAPIISSGAGAPGSTPSKVGDVYIDTTADTVYVATDTVSSADWDLVPNAAAVTAEIDGDVSTHAALTTTHGISAFGATLVDDADAPTARTTLGVDAAGTDNSTDVTLAGTPDYITIAGQVITRNQIDLTADVTGVLPEANLPDASATAQGVVEIATAAEVDTGTDDTRAISPLALAGSALKTKVDGIETAADVTDAANVASAGAVMADGTGNDITGDIVFTEKADHSSTPGAGKGYLWTKNTAPSTLIFTDDTGADTTLGAAGGGISNVVEDTTPQLGGQLDVNGNAIGDGTLELLAFTETGSAVNHVNITNAATGNGPTVSAVGDDTNVDLVLAGKGSGVPKIGSNAVLHAGNDVDDLTNITYNTQSGTTYTLALADAFKTVDCTNAAQVTVTIPTNASVAFATGTRVAIWASGAGGVTLSTTSITLKGSSPNKTIAQNEILWLEKVATDTWIVAGGTAA